MANDCLLKLAGITPTTPDPEGGRYGRMNGTGDLDGYAEEPAAMNPFYAVTTPRLAWTSRPWFPTCSASTWSTA